LWTDSGAGILVAGMICTTGSEILYESVKQLTDTTDEQLVQRVENVLNNNNDVASIKRVRARTVGSNALVDVSITTNEDLSISATRAIEERLRWKILENEANVMDAIVHIEGTEGKPICPLLTAHGDQRVPGQVSSEAISLMMKYPDILNVVKCTVDFEETILVNIEAVIRLRRGVSMQQALLICAKLRRHLQDKLHINRACIYLDLETDR